MELLLVFSHLIGFLVLAAASILDLKHGEVPDIYFLIGILAGLVSHRFYGFLTQSYDVFVWSLGLGLLFFVYGWLAYIKGMWGGADALALAVLGFTVPTALDGSQHVLDLIFNLMIVILVYSVLFVFLKSLNSDGFYRMFFDELRSDSKRLSLELSLAVIFAGLMFLVGISFVFYLFLLVFMIFLYRFLSLAEEEVFTETIPVEELEGGEVLAEEYSDERIRGVTEDELKDLAVDEVDVQDGVRLVPVFVLTLIVTDLGILGFEVLANIV